MATLSSLPELYPSEILVAIDADDGSTVQRLTSALDEPGCERRFFPPSILAQVRPSISWPARAGATACCSSGRNGLEAASAFDLRERR